MSTYFIYRRLTISLILLVSFLFLLHPAPIQSQNSPSQVIEAENSAVSQSGTWHTQSTAQASGGAYLYSSGDEADVLTLEFEGNAIEVRYIAGPQLGTLAIDVDGIVLRTVISTAEKTAYGQSAIINYLSDEAHTLNIYAQAGGVIAVDAFLVSPSVSVETGGAVNVANDDISDPQASACVPPNAIHRINLTYLGQQATGGNSYIAALSATSRYVAFRTEASLVVGDANGAFNDVYLYDRQACTLRLVSINTTGWTAGDNHSVNPAISADGRYIAFETFATTLVTGDTNGVNDIIVYDRQAATTTRVSVATGGAQGNNHSVNPAISADGRYVAFQSLATTLVTGDTNGWYDIFVYDRQTATTTRVSVATGGAQGNDPSVNPAISADGRYVAFHSLASNLVTGDTNGFNDIFVHDRQTATTTRVSMAMGGAQGDNGSYEPAISADGRYVAFESLATNLVSGDSNGQWDIFVTPRVLPVADTLAIFNPNFATVGLFDTLADNPAIANFTSFSAYAPPTTAGQWVMGDWDGDGLKTPGVYMNGPFYYTNRLREGQAGDWRSLWIGIAGPPVAGRFNGALPNDCIGVVQTASLGGSTVFVLYFTCQLDGTPAPMISNQWLSAVLPDAGGFSGAHQFGTGDFNSDGVDSIGVRRGTFIAYGNIAPATGPATFDLAQYIGAPGTGDAGTFVVGDWDANGADSFGLYYQNGEFFYRNDLLFNSGVYINQTTGAPYGTTGIQAATWR